MRKRRSFSFLAAAAVTFCLISNVPRLEQYALSISILSNDAVPSSLRQGAKARPVITILGISTSSEMKSAILSTYLKNSSKHAFSNTCQLEKYTKNSTCTMVIQFLDESMTEADWWQYLLTVDEGSDIMVGQKSSNRFVLWTTGNTILYPKHLISVLNGVWKTAAFGDLFYAAAPSVDCSRVRPKPDQKVCNKLSGTLTVATFPTVLRTRSCWLLSQDAEQCRAELNLSTYQLPRQLRQPDSGGFLFFWNKWLVSWNDLPSQLSYVTAKFGKDNFRNLVELSQSALLSLGLDETQVHAYYEFPDFIMNDSRWKLHLEFLDDSVIPPVRPKGGGYYFWKAPLIMHHLKESSKEGDFIVYSDVGRRDPNKWLSNLLQFMHLSNTSLALYETDLLERQYNKRDAYQYYCGENQDPVQDTTYQLGSSMVVVRKTEAMVAFLNEWQNGMTHYTMLNDRPSKLEDVEDFVQHKHDQSLLSVILKCRYSQAYTERQLFDVTTETTSSAAWPVYVFQI